MEESIRGLDSKIATGLPPERDASDEDKGLYTVARWAAQNDHFVGFYKTWTKSINFLIGEHWRTRWDGTSLTWQSERDIPPWAQQPVTNLVYAIYRAALAKLTKQKPTLEVVPRSGDSEDKEAAELSESLLTYLWRYLKKPQKLPVALGWLLVTSLCYVRVGWDPLAGESRPRTVPLLQPKQGLGAPDDAGAPPPSDEQQPGQPNQPVATVGDLEEVNVAADEQGEPYKTEDGQPDFEREPDEEPIGDICWQVVSPLCVRWNPEATSPEDATECYVGTLWPKNKAAEHFGLKESDIMGPSDSAEQRALYDDLMSATAASFPRSWADQTSQWGVSQQDAIGDRVLVIEYYSKQSPDFKNGRHWITVGAVKAWPPTSKEQASKVKHEGVYGDGEPFENGEAPLPFGFWPPLVPGMDTPIPGQPTGVSLLSQVVPLNEQLNHLDGKIAEKHDVDSLGGIWFASTEDKGLQITSEPGQVVLSKAMARRGQAFAPFQAQLHALAEPVYREREVITNKAMMVSGMSGLDLSQKPQGGPSGRALLVTQETSDSVLMPTLFAIEAMLEECGRRELLIAQQKYTAERTISVQGENGEWLFRSFTNADLRAGHDVLVQVGSSFPWSKAAQWDTKLSIIEALPPLVTKPDGTIDKQALAKYLDAGMPGLSAFDSEEDPDLVEIQREHAMFAAYDPSKGEQQLPQIAFWQNHATHLEEHFRFMKRDFGRFQRWSPAAQAAFKQHMQLTMVAVDDAMGRMMPSGPGAAGASGGAPGAPPNAEAAAPDANGGNPPLQVLPGGRSQPPTQLQRSDFAAAQRA